MNLTLNLVPFIMAIVLDYDIGGRLLFNNTGVEHLGFKLFSCSTPLRMTFKLLIDIEVPGINGISRFKSLKSIIYLA